MGRVRSSLGHVLGRCWWAAFGMGAQSTKLSEDAQRPGPVRHISDDGPRPGLV